MEFELGAGCAGAPAANLITLNDGGLLATRRSIFGGASAAANATCCFDAGGDFGGL